MVVTDQLKNQHLLWRAGFGPMAEDLDSLATGSPQTFVSARWKASSKTPATILNKWLGADDKNILGRQSSYLDFI